MQDSKKGSLPLHHGTNLSKAQCPSTSDAVEKMSRVPYALAIGSIMYAMTCTPPDVLFTLSMVSQYQDNPGKRHWTAVKNILKYLRNTKEKFLVFGGKNELKVSGYSDASFQTDRDDSAVALTKEPKDHGRSRHILRKYHYVRHKVESKDIVVNRVSLEDNLTDPFTKALSKIKHDEHAKSIGMRDDISFSS
ncbi:hypothetical protein L2E82_44949 [Cichorium intybus]|uniref:Uncharacterized protein n=1 Tax=Cichorium intybus TaxID=13427 RepID=A0ACB8ZSY7_CICIN|nr:hypothetical protein L2E82_44949 [Cichorium intybus]